MDKYLILKEKFGFTEFKYPQDSIIDNVFKGNEVIGLLPTGFGKSIIYQVLALMLDGLSIVITPLISLMEDQIANLKKKNISAVMLNSSVPWKEQEAIFQKILMKKYKILYVSPERLSNIYFLKIMNICKISLVVVDEAHTILWADGFREAFGEIGSFLHGLATRPKILAVTATATAHTLFKIKTILGMKEPKVIEASIDRRNLVYKVLSPKDKNLVLLHLIQTHKKEKGIIYCLTRRKVEELYYILQKKNIACSYYHAGLEAEVKKQNQRNFTKGEVDWLVCTNAFGMGIDIPDIRLVIAYELPQSLEDLVQQMGRAARDGKHGEGIVLFSFKDIKTINYFIEQQSNTTVRSLDRKKRDILVEYCLTRKCRHKFIGNYFNQAIPVCKDKCDNCIKKSR